MHPSPKYLLGLTSGILGLIAVAAGVNYWVDPYGIYRSPPTEGTRGNKPTAASKGPLVKAYQIERAQARTLVLGNSRAEIGFDPEDSAWPAEAQPVYNAALPGTWTDVSLLYLQNALVATRPSTVILGVDFPDFLVAPDERPALKKASSNSELEARLRVDADGNPNPDRPRQRLRDTAATVFSLDAIIDSVRTVAARNNPYSENLTARGFNPMRDYVLIARNDGYRSMFLQKDQANIKAYLKRPRAIYRLNSATSTPLEHLQHIIAVCREHNIQLKLVIYPYHARLLEIISATGHWSAFEQWKGALARIVDEDAAAHAGATLVTLWDFSGYNTFTTEPVPAPHDLRTQTNWFWEAGHFKSELGNVVLKTMFRVAHRAPAEGAEIGAVLSPENLAARIANTRRERELYLTQYPSEVAEIQELVRRLGAKTD